LPVPDPRPGESVNDYVYRVLNERLDEGGTPRGLVSNSAESKSEVLQRVKVLHEQRYLHEMAEFERVRREAQTMGQLGAIPERYQSMPVLKTPGIRCLNNDLSRLALEVMRQRSTAAGVRWLELRDTRPEVQRLMLPLPQDHPVAGCIATAMDLNLLESTLGVEFKLFRQLVAQYFHDSRWCLDLPRRKRDVFFGGRKS